MVAKENINLLVIAGAVTLALGRPNEFHRAWIRSVGGSKFAIMKKNRPACRKETVLPLDWPCELHVNEPMGPKSSRRPRNLPTPRYDVQTLLWRACMSYRPICSFTIE